MLKVIKGDSKVGARLIARRGILRGSMFFRLHGLRLIERPTYQTVQIGPSRHALSLGVLTFLNHSCQPNVIIDTRKMECRAIVDIAQGEELSYFYPSTEWEMARPFLCLCGAANCIRIVAGARQLPTDVLSRYFINEHIRTLIVRELGTASRKWSARLAAAASSHPGRVRRIARR